MYITDVTSSGALPFLREGPDLDREIPKHAKEREWESPWLESVAYLRF